MIERLKKKSKKFFPKSTILSNVKNLAFLTMEKFVLSNFPKPHILFFIQNITILISAFTFKNHT